MTKATSYILLLSVLLWAVFLPSCAAREYKGSQTCAELAWGAASAIPSSKGYSAYGDDHIKYEFGNTELYNDCCIIYSNETEDVNEIGVFHMPDADSAKEFAKIAENYIFNMREDQRAFIESYAPNEVPKLDGARIYILGNYVVYTVLSAKDRDKVMESIESQLGK